MLNFAGLLVVSVSAVLVLAGSAAAQEATGTPPVAGSETTPAATSETPVAPAPSEGAAVYETNPPEPAGDPERYPRLDVPTKPWAYDTRYFFQLTRGLVEENLAPWCRRASMVGTVPLDVAVLPAAAVAGLFGS